MNGHRIPVIAALVAPVLIFLAAGAALAQRGEYNPGRGPAGKPLTVCCKVCKGGKCTYAVRTAERCRAAGGVASNRSACRRVCCRAPGPRAFIWLPQQACRDRRGTPQSSLYCSCPRSGYLVCCETRKPRRLKRMTERRCCFQRGRPVAGSRCRK